MANCHLGPSCANSLFLSFSCAVVSSLRALRDSSKLYNHDRLKEEEMRKYEKETVGESEHLTKSYVKETIGGGGGKVINHALTFVARRETNNFFPSCLLNIGFGVIVGISNHSLTHFLTSSSFRCF